jgi:hypothetical protein
MVKTRARRDDPAPGPGQLVLRGILGDAGLDVSDLRQAAMLNAELYGFYGVSVWVTEKDWPRERLEATKLVRFERYAELTVVSLTGRGLTLWATGQPPHYDVVDERNDLESLVTLMAATPYVIRDNPSLDREEH